jgi:predicted regulator of Ras-like GTPase activity (Roadblock/LC7/MglB family)
MENVKATVDGPPSSTSGFVPPRAPTAALRWTAPDTTVASAPAPAAPTAPVASSPAPVATTPSGVLDGLVEGVDEVRGAILASVDGFGLARSTSMADEPSHPAMLAAAVGLAHQLVSIGGGDHLRQLVVDHDGGLLLIWPIGTERVLAVLTSSRVDQRHLRLFVHDRVAVLSGATA